MGFLGSILGTTNDYRAQAPVNSFQATPAQLAQQNYSPAIGQAQQAALGSMGAGDATGGQQSALAAALQARMNGQGPSVAEQQLQRATDQNTQQAASLIGSQRGINPGLGGRLIAQQAAGAGQQMAGQAATLRAQEQIANSGLLAQALAAQRGQDIAQQGANTSLYGTSGMLQQGQNALNLQNSMGTQGLNQATASQNANLNLQAQNINAGITNQNASNNMGLVGGLIGGAGAALAGPIGMGMLGGAGGLTAGSAGMGVLQAGGPVMEAGLGIAGGGEIPGTAPVKGDSPANDKVPAMLSPKEIVLPRSVTLAQDPGAAAKEFVEAIKAHKGTGPEKGYGRVLAIKREYDTRIKRLEALAGVG